ncbi:hypothetical protein CC78DRAFT_578817 [Lojkania enalia]|uniref:Uncharacterized protein n=1 Tax=Lojkania enalia TaxID=147567 RepID=A0A9P4KE17_9PLEO|nr:hypothetical protein CC78DRAFT_578817 [Didymosphaeria enalia]
MAGNSRHITKAMNEEWSLAERVPFKASQSVVGRSTVVMSFGCSQRQATRQRYWRLGLCFAVSPPTILDKVGVESAVTVGVVVASLKLFAWVRLSRLRSTGVHQPACGVPRLRSGARPQQATALTLAVRASSLLCGLSRSKEATFRRPLLRRRRRQVDVDRWIRVLRLLILVRLHPHPALLVCPQAHSSTALKTQDTTSNVPQRPPLEADDLDDLDDPDDSPSKVLSSTRTFPPRASSLHTPACLPTVLSPPPSPASRLPPTLRLEFVPTVVNRRARSLRKELSLRPPVPSPQIPESFHWYPPVKGLRRDERPSRFKSVMRSRRATTSQRHRHKPVLVEVFFDESSVVPLNGGRLSGFSAPSRSLLPRAFLR